MLTDKELIKMYADFPKSRYAIYLVVDARNGAELGKYIRKQNAFAHADREGCAVVIQIPKKRVDTNM